jgi:hypothetical protein
VFCKRNANWGLHGTGSAVESTLEEQPTSSVKREGKSQTHLPRVDGRIPSRMGWVIAIIVWPGQSHIAYSVSVPKPKVLHVCGLTRCFRERSSATFASVDITANFYAHDSFCAPRLAQPQVLHRKQILPHSPGVYHY